MTTIGIIKTKAKPVMKTLSLKGTDDDGDG